MLEFPESRLVFKFDDQWQVLKWDEDPAYTAGLQRFQQTKAVDFFALYNGTPYFIEVKNFRRYRIENKRRLTSDELVREVSQKVRDTIGGATWAQGRTHHDSRLDRFLRPLFTDRKCKVVLWLEEDLSPRPADRSALAGKLRHSLQWLNPHVLVLDRSAPLPGVVVRGAPELDA